MCDVIWADLKKAVDKLTPKVRERLLQSLIAELYTDFYDDDVARLDNMKELCDIVIPTDFVKGD